jgi:hypothetical protein
MYFEAESETKDDVTPPNKGSSKLHLVD